MAHPLDGSRLKLERASFHMTELDEAFRSYLKRAAEFKNQPGRPDMPWAFQIKSDPLLPTFPVMIGEAIQCMRSALDYLVYELAGLAGASVRARRRTQFPIATYAADYFRGGRHKIRPLRGEHRRRIRKLQPYQSKANVRAHPLAILNRLSNTDKHRLLLTVAQQSEGIALRMSGKGGKVTIHGTKAAVFPAYLKNTNVLDAERADPDLGAIVWVELVLSDESDALVMATLKTVLWAVTEIIDEFAPAFE